jgi:hypothetical protein
MPAPPETAVVEGFAAAGVVVALVVVGLGLVLPCEVVVGLGAIDVVCCGLLLPPPPTAV